MGSAGSGNNMKFQIKFDREENGRWIAEIESLPGVLVYGVTREEAKIKAETLAKQVILEQA
jgi:predicted RNase H-like HicB family nuclease